MAMREITLVKWEVRCGKETIHREAAFDREEAASDFTDELKAAYKTMKLDWDCRIITTWSCRSTVNDF